MDARWMRFALTTTIFFCCGASYRTANFVVEAPTQDLAEAIGRAAEQFRKDLAIEWLGKALPNWSRPCPITAKVEPNLGAGGATSFVFDQGEVFDWKMNIQGLRERVLDLVLPHEVTHTIFASYFRRPLPRWADEGACTTVEDASERGKQQRLLIQFLQTGRGIAFNQMFAMKEYPRDMLPLYAQGYSLGRFLIDRGGRQKFIAYLSDGMKSDNWPAATRNHYQITDLSELQTAWLDWVRQGSPQMPPSDRNQAVASNSDPRASKSGIIYRGQSKDDTGPADDGLVPIPIPPTQRASLPGSNTQTASAVSERATAGRSRYERPAADFADDFTPREAFTPLETSPVSTASATRQMIFEWRKLTAAE